MNFILKKQIDGFEGNVQSGRSQHNDNKSNSASLAWGSGFDNDRGRVMIASEFNKLSDVAMQKDRDWGRQHWAMVSGSVNGGPVIARNTVTGAQMSGATTGGTIAPSAGGVLPTTDPLRGIQFGPGGKVLPFIYGTNVGAQMALGGSGAWTADDLSLSPPLERKNIYARATYKIADNIRGTAEASLAQSTTDIFNLHAITPGGSDLPLLIKAGNPYLPVAIRDIMTANKIASFNLSRINDEFGMNENVITNTTKRVVLGLDGSFGDDWKWKAYATRGQNNYDAQIHGMINEVNFRSAIDVISGPNGAPICNPVTVAALGADAGCVPANPFGQGSLTDAVKNYATGTMRTVADITQTAGGASIEGVPFSNWAGKVSVASGLEYRKEELVQQADSNSLRTAPALTGVTAALDGVWQYGNPKPIGGSANVKEIFAETIIPLALDMPLVKSLDFNSAVRRTDYSLSGPVTSWKAGVTYSPIREMLFRGTRSLDIRAPNLNEQFAAGSQSVTSMVDPLLKLTYTARQVSVGNPDLKPETAETTIFGLTWEPSAVKGLRASVDWWNIDLKGAIARVNAASILNGCYGVNGSKLTPSYCTFITRDPVSNRIAQVRPPLVNLNAIKTDGIDFEVSYRFPLNAVLSETPGNVTVRLLGTYVKSFVTNDGKSIIDNAGDQVGGAKLNMNLTTGYKNGPLSLFATGRYIQSTLMNNNYGPADIDNNVVPSRFYVNTSGLYKFYERQDGSDMSLFFKIDNLLNKNPPITAGTSNQPFASGAPYDLIGRTFTLGLRFNY